MFAKIGESIVAKLNSDSAYSALVDEDNIGPVIVPQKSTYPYVTYEIVNVSNFLVKDVSLKTCEVEMDITCFCNTYNETYNISKAIVGALDKFEGQQLEDGITFKAKFSFDNLRDGYFPDPEKFYKTIQFNILINKI